jgi:hypothetical protein
MNPTGTIALIAVVIAVIVLIAPSVRRSIP